MGLKILIAEAHDVLRKGLKTILEKDTRVCKIYEVTNESNLHRQLLLHPLDLIIASQSLVTDIALLDKQKFVILADKPDLAFLKATFQHNGSGYFSTNVSAELLCTILSPTKDSFLIEPTLVPWILEQMFDFEEFRLQENLLTPREREIFALLREGNSNSAIARKLGIAETTIKTHIKNIAKNGGKSLLKQQLKAQKDNKTMGSSSTTNIWFQYWQRKPQARIRLFCFPYAGGGASIYHSWSDLLPSEIEVCPIQLPGRENRLFETPFSQIDQLMDPLSSALLPYLDMPFAFFGHSMGSLIGFELAKYLQLKELSKNLQHLFVSGHRAPQLPDVDPPIHHLPKSEFIKELRRLEGTPEEVLANAELLDLIMPHLRADFGLCETYDYVENAPLECPITAFGGLQDKEATHSDLAAWQMQTNHSFKMRFFTGGHFFLHEQSASLLQAISLDLFPLLV